jgi:diacylglycerol O-acyltransferase
MSDRLSLLDASLLQLESARVPLHTGGLGVFAPGLTFADVHETLAGRLDEIPLARQRLQEVPYAAGRPVWVDDQHFDLSYHLRHAALPSPGGPAALAEVLARIFSRQLDRSRPLWELYVIEGLEGGRTGAGAAPTGSRPHAAEAAASRRAGQRTDPLRHRRPSRG